MHVASQALMFSRCAHATQQIEMGVAMQIEVAQIRNPFVGAAGGHLPCHDDYRFIFEKRPRRTLWSQ